MKSALRQQPLPVETVYLDGFRAGEWMRKRGVNPKALIKGSFRPAFAFADHGRFQVMVGSLCEYETELRHSDVQEFWRGFVTGFDHESV